MGEVFRAEDRLTGRVVAIKTLTVPPTRGSVVAERFRKSQIQRFKREYRVASRLDHPHCVRSHLLGRSGDELFIVMDYAGGGSLRPLARKRLLEVRHVVALGLQALDALDYLHSHAIIHRDIKTANLLLESPLRSDSDAVPKLLLTDFGIAKIGDLNDDRHTGQFLGTPAYLAPECAAGSPGDPRADLYALGIVLFELLSGEHPLSERRGTSQSEWMRLHAQVRPRHLQEVRPGLPSELGDLISELLDKDPDRRPRTAAIIYDRLQGIARALGMEESGRPERSLQGSPYLAVPSFVGRSQELEAARSFLQARLDGDAQDGPAPAGSDESVMVIEGEAGSGKSRLLEQLLFGADRPAMVIDARQDATRPFETVMPLVAEVFANRRREAPSRSTSDGSTGPTGRWPPRGSSAPATPTETPARERRAEPLARAVPALGCDTVDGDDEATRAARPAQLEAVGATTSPTLADPEDLDDEPTRAATPARIDALGGEPTRTVRQRATDTGASVTRNETPPGGAEATLAARPTPIGAQPEGESSSGVGSSRSARRAPSSPSGLAALTYSDRHGFERFKEDFAEAFIAHARTRPALVVVEDAQWIDLESLDLLAYLILRLRQESQEQNLRLPVAFIFSLRPASPDNRSQAVLEKLVDCAEGLRRLELPPMSGDQARQLIGSLLMLETSERAQPVYEALFGSRKETPLFLVQTLQILLLNGELTRGQRDAGGRWSGHWNLDFDARALARLPLTVQDAIGDRSARLSVETHAMLEAAAVVGKRFERGLLRDLIGVHPNKLNDLIDEATEAGFLIQEDDASLSSDDSETVLETVEPGAASRVRIYDHFCYDRYREVIYSGIAEERRRDLHRAVAERLEAHYEGRERGSAEIATHFHRGGLPAKAHAHGLRAAHYAVRKGAIFRAADAMALALNAAREAGIAESLRDWEFHAELCLKAGRFEEAADAYDRCLALGSEGKERLRLLGRKSECNLRKGNFAEAAQPLEEVLILLGDAPPRSRLARGARLLLGSIWTVLIGLVPSLRRADPLRTEAASLGELAARAWQKLSEVYAYISPLKTLFSVTRCASLAARLGPGSVTASCYAVTGYAFATAGLRKLARSYTDAAREVVAHQLPADQTFAMAMCLGERVFSGDLKDGLELAHRTIEVATQAQDVSRSSFGLVFAEAAMRYLGRFEAAQALAAAIRRLGDLAGHDQLTSYGPMFAGMSALARLDRDFDYQRSFENAAASARRRGDKLMELVAKANLLVAEPLSKGGVPELEEILTLGDELIEGRFVTASANPRATLTVALALYVIRARPDAATTRRILRLRKRLRASSLVQKHEAGLFWGASAAIDAGLGDDGRARTSLLRCAQELEQTGMVYPRAILGALLQEAGLRDLPEQLAVPEPGGEHALDLDYLKVKDRLQALNR